MGSISADLFSIIVNGHSVMITLPSGTIVDVGMSLRGAATKGSEFVVYLIVGSCGVKMLAAICKLSMNLDRRITESLAEW